MNTSFLQGDTSRKYKLETVPRSFWTQQQRGEEPERDGEFLLGDYCDSELRGADVSPFRQNPGSHAWIKRMPLSFPRPETKEGPSTSQATGPLTLARFQCDMYECR